MARLISCRRTFILYGVERNHVMKTATPDAAGRATLVVAYSLDIVARL